MSDSLDNVVVVIRSVKERTEELCKSLMIQQGVPEEQVHVLNVSPFSAAVKKSFEIGMASGKKWTLCNDADVLLRAGAIQTMLQLADEQPGNVCEVQSYVLDKFFGGQRKGGVHIYRSEFLPMALECIPAEGVNIRPEHHTLKMMQERGYPWVNLDYVVGVHDFEQDYEDIFRKCFVQAHKHQHYTKMFVGVWREKAAEDMDYRVALKGYARGLEHFGEVYIDNRQQEILKAFEELGIKEKDVLAVDRYTPEDIDKMVREWELPEAYLDYYPKKNHVTVAGKVERKGGLSAVKNSMKERGTLKTIPYLLGSVFHSVGLKLISFSGVKP
jgi:hypothetical protein